MVKGGLIILTSTSFSIVSSSPLSIHIHSSLSCFISSLNPISIQYSHWCSFIPHTEHFPKQRLSPLRPPHPYTELSIHTSRTPFTFILHVSMEKVVHLLKLNIHITHPKAWLILTRYVFYFFMKYWISTSLKMAFDEKSSAYDTISTFVCIAFL